MKAATLTRAGRFEIGGVGDPEPGAGEVLLEIRGCGICGSNLPPWSGAAAVSYPLASGAPGHEAFGTVVARGVGVQGVEVGQRVTALTYRSFADLDVASADTVVPIPDSLAAEPVLGEPLACAVNVVKRAGIEEDDVVVVLGAGFPGALLLQLARRRARPRWLIAVSRRSEGRELALRMGADLAIAPEGVEAVAIAADHRLADVVIEATGYQAPLDLAAHLTRVRGRLVIAGYHQTGKRQVDLQLWNWKGLDVVNAHERDPAVYRRGMEEGLALLERREIDLGSLITHRYRLDEINEAFRTAAEMPDAFIKAMVSSGDHGG